MVLPWLVVEFDGSSGGTLGLAPPIPRLDGRHPTVVPAGVLGKDRSPNVFAVAEPFDVRDEPRTVRVAVDEPSPRFGERFGRTQVGGVVLLRRLLGEDDEVIV